MADEVDPDDTAASETMAETPANAPPHFTSSTKGRLESRCDDSADPADVHDPFGRKRFEA